MKKEKDHHAVELGKKSAEVRRKKGHDSKYYSDLAKKRWAKKREKFNMFFRENTFELLCLIGLTICLIVLPIVMFFQLFNESVFAFEREPIIPESMFSCEGEADCNQPEPTLELKIEDKILKLFPDDPMMLVIAYAESRLGADRIGDKHLANYSYGIFQINLGYHNYSLDCLFDVECNLQAAKDIYESFKARTGDGKNAWSTWKNGSYKNYLYVLDKWNI